MLDTNAGEHGLSIEPHRPRQFRNGCRQLSQMVLLTCVLVLRDTVSCQLFARVLLWLLSELMTSLCCAVAVQIGSRFIVTVCHSACVILGCFGFLRTPVISTRPMPDFRINFDCQQSLHYELLDLFCVSMLCVV